jgi:hypothetical protein
MHGPLKSEFHDVISGKIQVRFGRTIQAVASHLGEGPKPGASVEDPKHFKQQEAARLEKFVAEHDLMMKMY